MNGTISIYCYQVGWPGECQVEATKLYWGRMPLLTPGLESLGATLRAGAGA